MGPKQNRKKEQSELFQNILSNKPLMNVVKNSVYNFWEETETRFVFDPVEKIAVGVHDGNGKISAFSADDLELAKLRGWKTVAVENLKVSSLDD